MSGQYQICLTGLVCLNLLVGTNAALICDDPVFDFGERDESATVTHVFSVINTGAAPVRISKVQSSCGCTTTGVAKEEIGPGESVDITASISLRGRLGRQNYSLIIRTDNPAQPVYRLGIQGVVIRDFMVDPNRLDFHWPSVEGGLSARLQMVSGGTEFSVKSVRVSDPLINVEVHTVRPGIAYVLVVQLNKEQIAGPFEGKVMVETDHPRHPQLQIPVSVLAGGGVLVRPTALTLAARPADVPQRRMLIVYSRSAQPFTIERVDLPEGAGSTIRTASPHRHDIHIEGLMPNAILRRTPVRILTSLGETLEVPFRMVE